MGGLSTPSGVAVVIFKEGRELLQGDGGDGDGDNDDVRICREE